VLSHTQRIDAARSAIDYITGRTDVEQRRPVPNCPGWTVYNAAAHIGRVGIAWEEMITSPPEDPESRERGYRRSAERPAGTSTAELAAWAHSAIDELVDDVDRRCHFSMTGGEGTASLWAWHAASELGVHRLDVEAALEHNHSLTDEQAVDAATYTCRYFLPAMRRVTGPDTGPVTARLVGGHSGIVGEATIESEAAAGVTVEGPATQVLLALWGRPHSGVEVTAGDPAVWERWRALPGQAFQFGTWD
jgi:uncharacterized protein (TIGR03083 family)